MEIQTNGFYMTADGDHMISPKAPEQPELTLRWGCFVRLCLQCQEQTVKRKVCLNVIVHISLFSEHLKDWWRLWAGGKLRIRHYIRHWGGISSNYTQWTVEQSGVKRATLVLIWTNKDQYSLFLAPTPEKNAGIISCYLLYWVHRLGAWFVRVLLGGVQKTHYWSYWS